MRESDLARNGRYGTSSKDLFDERVQSMLRQGTAVLDIGPGRTPTVPPGLRPAGCHYVGLDVSLHELELAPPGSYDELVVADVAEFLPELRSRFDLVISWQVLEHVRSLDLAFENMRAYLRPGGRLVAHMSGAWSLFGIANRVLPHAIAVRLLKWLLHRDPATVFPAPYNHCWHSALVTILRTWSSFEIVSRYIGAGYLKFAPGVQWLYLRYEDWALSRHHLNLATHYLVQARK